MLEGEIENPGIYVLPGSISPESLANDGPLALKGNDNDISSSAYFPSLFDGIKKSGGITNYSDLSKVEITRIDTISNGGSRKKAIINFKM